jgi:hypothetical protein
MFKADNELMTLVERMTAITKFQKMEKFKKSWFKIDKMTASNYRDMVLIFQRIAQVCTHITQQIRQLPAITFDYAVAEALEYFSQFLYYCHYVSHNKSTLREMESILHKFKDEVEKYFFAWDKFKQPKYHIMNHYMDQIRKFGSLLNGDTESTERLHGYVKKAYKNTNKKVNIADLRKPCYSG